MKCNYCGCEVRDDAKFCPICGASLEQEKETIEAEVIEETFTETKSKETKTKSQAKCWTIFCKVAKILGYCSFIPFAGFEAGAAGIVFAILGKNSNNAEAQEMRKTGLTCSIVGLAINFTLIVLLEFAMIFISIF